MSDARVLVLGGYGTFGWRLAQLLADEPRLSLLIAGRARDKAEAFCARLRATAQLEPLAFDREGDVEAALIAAKPDVVVDASGPFQACAGDPYRLVRASASTISTSPMVPTSSQASRSSMPTQRRAASRSCPA